MDLWNNGKGRDFGRWTSTPDELAARIYKAIQTNELILGIGNRPKANPAEQYDIKDKPIIHNKTKHGENEEIDGAIHSMNAYLDKKEDDKIDAKQDRISYLSSIGISDPSLQAKLAEMMETDEYKILEVEDAIAMNIHNANESAQAVADNLNPIQQNNQGYSQSGSNNMQNVTSATVDAGGIGGMSC